MPHDALVTGPPRSGKTTALERTVERLRERGLCVGGVSAPELRTGGERVGFEIRDVLADERAADEASDDERSARRVLAHVDRKSGPRVGKYRVDVEAVDDLCATAFPRAFEAADVVVVDEVAPMEVHGDVFVEGVRRALDADQPLVAAVHYRSESGFVGEVKSRDDADLFEVDERTRDDLPDRLVELVTGWLDGGVAADEDR